MAGLVLSGCAPTPTPTSPPPVTAAYVGSEKCKTCHSEQYKEWKETLHSKMIQDVKKHPEAIIGDFTKDKVRTFNKDQVVYTIGNKWKQRYLTKIGEEYYILPAQWIVATEKWKPYHAAEWKERPWSKKCQGCHTTGFDPEAKTFCELFIACESCHGPGKEHAATADPEKIVKIADAQVCGQCHTGGEIEPGATVHHPQLEAYIRL